MGTDVRRFPKALAWGPRGRGGFLVPEEHPGRATFGSCCLVPEGSTLSQVSPVGPRQGLAPLDLACRRLHCPGVNQGPRDGSHLRDTARFRPTLSMKTQCPSLRRGGGPQTTAGPGSGAAPSTPRSSGTEPGRAEGTAVSADIAGG